MELGAIIIIIVIAIILILVFYVIGEYNKLLDRRNKVEDKFKVIDKELNKKMELIPELTKIVESNTKHEDKKINQLVSANYKLEKASTYNEKIDALICINKVLDIVFQLEEVYPILGSNKKYLSIKKKLDTSDDKINYASSFYNAAVKSYNELREQFPLNIIAKIFKFNKIDYYK